MHCAHVHVGGAPQEPDTKHRAKHQPERTQCFVVSVQRPHQEVQGMCGREQLHPINLHHLQGRSREQHARLIAESKDRVEVVLLEIKCFAACIGLPMTLQITARVTWTGTLHTARSLTDPYGLSGYLHRGTYIIYSIQAI